MSNTAYPLAELQYGQWPSSLCDICAAGPWVCLVASFFPYIQYGFNSEALATKMPGSGGNCACGCLAFACLYAYGCSCCIHSSLRGQVRAVNFVPSTNDCCITWCCACCALIQEAHLIDKAPHLHERQAHLQNQMQLQQGGGQLHPVQMQQPQGYYPVPVQQQQPGYPVPPGPPGSVQQGYPAPVYATATAPPQQQEQEPSAPVIEMSVVTVEPKSGDDNKL